MGINIKIKPVKNHSEKPRDFGIPLTIWNCQDQDKIINLKI
jgi:hypothetical protein